MAAQVVKRLPEGDDWIYELKFDGYRALIIKDEQRVELRSRKNKDLTGMYPGIAAAGLRVKADQAVLARHGLWHDDEGAIVAASQNYLIPSATQIVYQMAAWGNDDQSLMCCMAD